MSDLRSDNQSGADVHRELIRGWLRVAAADMENAQILLSSAPSSYTHVAVLCQQAVEKLLKAVLVRHGISVPRSHDLGRLLSLLLEDEPDLVSRSGDAPALSQYAVAPRYPDGYERMGLESATAIYEIADRVRTDVQALLANFLAEG